jgi:hypothetical protein
MKEATMKDSKLLYQRTRKDSFWPYFGSDSRGISGVAKESRGFATS